MSLNMNLFEKIFALVSLGGAAGILAISIMKSNKGKKHDAFKVREDLVKYDDVKMLYSTMSFFYLQGYKEKSIESLYKLQQILEIQSPQIIALPISREEFGQKYQQVLRHPKFRQTMDTFTHYLELRDTEAILNMKQLNINKLQNLYLIDQCSKIKKCKLIFARKNKQYYKQLALREKNSKVLETDLTLQQKAKIDDYTETLISEMRPSLKFTLFPESPFKIILGIIQPQLLQDTAKKWKQKFKQQYRHQVIQDEQVVEREKHLLESKGEILRIEEE